MLPEAGGAETLAAELCERLDPERFQRTVVTYRRLPESSDLTSQRQVVARLRRSGTQVVQLEARNRYDVAPWRPFVRLLRSGGVDILHSHKFGPNAWASLFARLAQVPVFVAHEHTWSYQGQPARRLADRWLIATRAAAFVAVSQRDGRAMTEIEGIPEDRIRVLPNGITAPAVDGVRDIRAELGIPATAPLLGAVGLMRAQKDFPSLLRAFRRVRERRPDARLMIVGDGPERAALERLADELGIREQLMLVGFREDAIALAAAFDVAVNSSRFEGSSLAVLEFMALGLPIVATAVGGTPDLLGGGAAGVLVPPGDPEALAQAIVGLVEDPGQARALGDRARERRRTEYDIGQQVRRLEQLYEELVARP